MTPSFLYPLQGAVFIAKHRILNKRVGDNLGRYILYAIPTLLFIYVGGWRVQRQVFDDVLKLRGVNEVRPLSEDERGRLDKAEVAAKPLPNSPPKGFQQRMVNLGTRIAKWLVNSAINRYLPLFTAPLLAIPVVGWVTYLGINGLAAGAEVHKPYFQKKGLTLAQQALVVKSRRIEYTAFGIVAFVMNLVPVLNYFFSLASTAGAALWAADLEASSEPLYKKQEDTTAKYK